MTGFNWPAIKDDIRRMREQFGMRPIRPGIIECLKCAREFKSADTKTNKMCGDCAKRSEKVGQPNDTVVEW